MIDIHYDEPTIDSSLEGSPTKIKVIGVGGAGGSAINRMIERGVKGVEFYACNTDAQVLNQSLAPNRIKIGESTTKGLGAGGDPAVGRAAADEDRERLNEIISGADMIFITAGLGGGTGTGASPLISELAVNKQILTVAVVSTPFSVEGKKRIAYAEKALAELREIVDALIVISNQQLITKVPDLSITAAYHEADEALRQSVQGVSDIITHMGSENIDFADVRTVISQKGEAWMATGIGDGENRVDMAVEGALTNPLLMGDTPKGATHILVNIRANEEITMLERNRILEAISTKLAHEGGDSLMITGYEIDPAMEHEIAITVFAAGFGADNNNRKPSESAQSDTAIHLNDLLGANKPKNRISDIILPPSARTFDNSEEYKDTALKRKLMNGHKK